MTMSYDIDSDVPVKKNTVLMPDDENRQSHDENDDGFQSPTAFKPMSIEFFGGADRKSLLDEVIHLCQFGNNLLAVVGEDGIGKSTFINQARIALSSTAFCCFIQANDTITPEDLFSQIISQLDLPVSPMTSAGEMIAALRHAIADGNLNRVVVIIDDANELGDAILSALISLLQGNQNQHLHILMAGKESLVDRLDQFEMVDVLVYDIELNPFSLQETKEYLKFRFDQTGEDLDEIFDSEQLASLWNESEGVPIKINRVAERMLSADEFEEYEDSFEKVRSLPVIHIGLLVVLLTALLLALVYMGGDDEELITQTSETTKIELPISSDISASADTKGSIQLSEDAETAEDAPISSNNIQTDNLLVDRPLIKEPDSTVASNTQAEFTNTVSVGETTNINEVATALQKPIAEPAKETVVIKSVPQIDNKKPLTTADNWLMGLSDDRYVIQVIAAGQKAGVEKFIASQPNKESLRLVQLVRENQPWYVALVGEYASNDAARQAINKLPQEQVNLGPWPRKASDLKREMAANSSK